MSGSSSVKALESGDDGLHDDEGGDGGVPAFARPEKVGVPEPNQAKRKRITLENAGKTRVRKEGSNKS